MKNDEKTPFCALHYPLPELEMGAYRPSDHAVDYKHILAAWFLAFSVAVIATGVPQLAIAVGRTESFMGMLPGMLTNPSDRRPLAAAMGSAVLTDAR
jgi:hypothetical protein